MPEVKYGTKVIRYQLDEREGLKSHYISVEKNAGVVLKGEAVSELKAQQLILKKARWIINKMALVNTLEEGDIVTGSRIQYLGKRFYTEVLFDERLRKATVTFNQSQFKISLHPGGDVQGTIREALHGFFRMKAKEKIEPRLRKWSKQTGLDYAQLRIMKLEKRWGSCTDSNTIILNVDVIKLPYTLIDYVIVHELCHTRVKNHSKEFWAELSKHLPGWKGLDEKMQGMGM